MYSIACGFAHHLHGNHLVILSYFVVGHRTLCRDLELLYRFARRLN